MRYDFLKYETSFWCNSISDDVIMMSQLHYNYTKTEGWEDIVGL